MSRMSKKRLKEIIEYSIELDIRRKKARMAARQLTTEEKINKSYDYYVQKVKKTAKKYLGEIPDKFNILNKKSFLTIFEQQPKYDAEKLNMTDAKSMASKMADKTLKQANIMSYNEAKSLMSLAQKDKELAESLGIEEPNAKNIRNVNNLREYDKYAENLYQKLKGMSDDELDEWVNKHGLKDISMFEGTYKLSHIWGELFYGS